VTARGAARALGVVAAAAAALGVAAVPAGSAAGAPVGGNRLYISPPTRVIDVRPGARVRHVVRVSNTTADEHTFDVTISRVVGSDEPDEVLEILHGDRGGAAAWLRATPLMTVVAPGATRVINVTGSVPPGAGAGRGSRAVAVSVTERSTVTSGASAQARLSSILVLELPGDEAPVGRVDRVVLEPRLVRGERRATLRLEISNTGERLLRPTGAVTLSGGGMRRPRSYPLPRATVFPGGRNLVEVPLTELPQLAVPTVRLDLTLGRNISTTTHGRLRIVPAWWAWGLAALGITVLLGLVRWLYVRQPLIAEAAPVEGPGWEH